MAFEIFELQSNPIALLQVLNINYLLHELCNVRVDLEKLKCQLLPNQLGGYEEGGATESVLKRTIDAICLRYELMDYCCVEVPVLVLGELFLTRDSR